MKLSALTLELRRIRYAVRIASGRFRNNEAVHAVFARLCKPGDCVVDVGANVGHYTKQLSDIVGLTGRVVAFEPVPETLALLAMNVLGFRHRNVTCLGLALDRHAGERKMAVPKQGIGKRNLYLSSFTTDDKAEFSVLAAGYDDLHLGLRPALINVCAEGAEVEVLQSMEGSLKSYHPILVVENRSEQARSWLEDLGYAVSHIADSPSVLAIKRERQT